MKPLSPAMVVLAILAVSLINIQTTLAQVESVGGDDTIAKACSSTKHEELCKKILESSPKSKGADLYGLAEIVMDIAADKASGIYATINQLQNGTTEEDSFMDQCLIDCLESYQDAIDQFEDSITALDFKAYNDIKTWVSAVMSDIKTCDMGFKDKPNHPSPITDMSVNLDQTCQIILAITNLLSEGKGTEGKGTEGKDTEGKSTEGKGTEGIGYNVTEGIGNVNS